MSFRQTRKSIITNPKKKKKLFFFFKLYSLLKSEHFGKKIIDQTLNFDELLTYLVFELSLDTQIEDNYSKKKLFILN